MTVSDLQLAAYRDGRLDPVSDAAVEELLMVDQTLRKRLGALAPPNRLDSVWLEVGHAIDQPAPGWLERVAGRLGVPEPAARLAGATPTLTRAWLYGIGGLVLLSLILSADTTQGDQRFLSYLLLAPLLVVLAVAAAYGRSTDPTHEITIAAPLAGIRLLLWRVLAVAPTAMIMNLAVGFLLRAGRFSFAWILPALACALATLALTTTLSVRRSASIVAAGYVVVVGMVAAGSADNLVAFRASGQLVFAVLAAVAGGLLVVFRGRLEEAVLR